MGDGFGRGRSPSIVNVLDFGLTLGSFWSQWLFGLSVAVGSSSVKIHAVTKSFGFILGGRTSTTTTRSGPGGGPFLDFFVVLPAQLGFASPIDGSRLVLATVPRFSLFVRSIGRGRIGRRTILGTTVCRLGRFFVVVFLVFPAFPLGAGITSRTSVGNHGPDALRRDTGLYAQDDPGQGLTGTMFGKTPSMTAVMVMGTGMSYY